MHIKKAVSKKKILKNKKGQIVACLYIEADGNLHPDSWLCENGWPSKDIKS